MSYRIRFPSHLFFACIAACLAIGCSKQGPRVPSNQTVEAVDAAGAEKNAASKIASDSLKFADIHAEEHEPFADEETKAIVVVFIATDCPIANYFQPTISEMAANTASDDVRFFLVHSDPDLEEEAAAKHADEFKVSSPVVLDRNQSIAKRLDAKVTPEAFVIDREGVVRYRGRINNLYAELGKRRSQPTTHDLRDAIEAVVRRKEIATPKTRAVGCYIPYPKVKVAEADLPK